MLPKLLLVTEEAELVPVEMVIMLSRLMEVRSASASGKWNVFSFFAMLGKSNTSFFLLILLALDNILLVASNHL